MLRDIIEYNNLNSCDQRLVDALDNKDDQSVLLALREGANIHLKINKNYDLLNYALDYYSGTPIWKCFEDYASVQRQL